MASLKDKRDVLLWVREMRTLQMQRAEQEAQACLRAETKAAAALDLANEQLTDVYAAWQERAAVGERLNPLLGELWRREMLIRESAQREAERSKEIAHADLSEARTDWGRSVVLSDHAEQRLREAQRRVEGSAEERRIFDMADLYSLRAVVR